MFTARSRTLTATALGLIFLAAIPLAAQVAGAKNVVINQIQPDQGDGQGLSVELYNYGPDQVMTNWHLEFQLDNGGSTTPSGFLFPSGFVLPRHGFTVVHWAAGSNGAVHLYRGAGAQSLTPDGELRLCTTLCPTGGIGVDYVLWGAPSPLNQPGNISWNGSVPYGSPPAQGYLQRVRDLNTRDANDWAVVQQTADAALNAGQQGVRRHGRVMINEVYPGSGCGGSIWVELYNPNSFAVSLNNAGLLTYNSSGTVCQNQSLFGIMAPGGTTAFNISGCANWRTNGTGEVILTDGAGEGWDYMAFGNPVPTHVPADVRWTGPNPVGNTVIYRTDDLDGDNGLDWSVSGVCATPTQNALNPGQAGVHGYDEFGGEVNNFGYTVPGRGNQINVTKTFFLRQWKLRALPAASAGAYLAIYQQNGANWNRIYQKALGSQTADGIYSTGAANLAIPVGVYRFMFYNGAAFNVWSVLNPAEFFSYGTYQGVANEATGLYPPPATTVMGAYSAVGSPIQQYFLTDPAPVITTTTPLAQCNTGVSCNRQFTATGTGQYTWAFTGAAIPGLTFAPSTGLLSGNPTTAGTYNFSIQVTDNNGMTDTKAFTLVVNFLYGPLSVTTASLPAATQNVPYSAPLAATGGDGVYAWSLFIGSLPTGMAIAPSGTVYGQPFTLGTYNFTVQVTDGQGTTAYRSLSLVVSNPLHIVNTSLPTGYPGVNYPATAILAAGGTAPYTYTLDATSAPLPPGITFAAGVLSGKPTTKGISNLVFRVTDNAGLPGVATQLLPLSVTDAPPLVQWEGRGLYGGDIPILVASPNFTTDSTAFAAGRLLEHFRTDDGGATWNRKVVSAAGLGLPIDRLLISPVFNSGGATASERTLFAANSSLGVYRSTDRGDTFIARNSGLPLAQGVTGLAISPNYATTSRLWIASTNTVPANDVIDIYTTVNGGDSWSYLSSITDPVFGLRGGTLWVSPTFATDNTLFALMGFGVGGTMYKRSTNGGLSWGSVGGPSITTCGTTAAGFRNLVLSPNFAVDRTVFGEDSCGVISRSVDSGATYTQLTQRGVSLAMLGRPGQTPLVYLKNGNALYGLSVSDNYGDSFTPVYASGLRASYTGASGPQRTVNAIAPVRRADGSIYMLAAGDKGVDGSFDGGASFNPRERGIAAMSLTSGAFTLAVRGFAGKLVAINYSNWLHSRDGGLHWTQRLPPWPADAQGVIWGVTSIAIAPYGTGDRVFISGNDQFYRSTDGGLNFTLVPSIAESVSDMAFAGDGTTMFATGFSTLYRSLDSGQTFQPLTSLPNTDACTPGGSDDVRSVVVSPNYATDTTLFAGTTNVCRSVNGGATWSALAGVPGQARITPSSTYNQNAASNANNAWTLYTGNNAGVLRSTDRGASWSAVGLVNSDFYWNVVVSPGQSSDRRVFALSWGPNASLYISSNDGASFAPLGAPDQLLTRPVSGLEFTGGAQTALAATIGGGVWRSTDGGASFAPVSEYRFLSDKVNALAAVPVSGTFTELVALRNQPRAPSAAALQQGSLLAATGDSGIFISNDDGATFDIFSGGLGNYTDARALAVSTAAPNNPVAITFDPAGGAAAGKVFRFSGGTWTATSLPTGTYNHLDDTGAALYATRLDGLTQTSGDGGVTWGGVDTGQSNIASVSYSNATGPTALSGVKNDPRIPGAITASYWSVAATSGARYTDVPAAAVWVAAPGGNDYTLPVLSGAVNDRYTTVRVLGINTASGGREVLAGTTGGLYLTRDGGATWRSVAGPGSGLEATSRNFSAMLSSPTAFSTTDVLVGATGTTNGGVYLSGDGGEHWTQINQGFDPSSLNISTLVRTSCSGCPVQYYTGTYGSGVYTRTIAVVAPPAITGWFFGSTSGTCAAAAGSGPEQGGQPFKLCGSGFLALPTVEFDGVPATGCAMSTASVITCTGTPAHIPGAVTVRVRNTDTRLGVMAAPYTYLAAAPRVVNSLRIAKAGSDAALSWSCAGCTAGLPARVYRSQNALFTLYNENYNGGASGSWSNTGVLAAGTSATYFWSVE